MVAREGSDMRARKEATVRGASASWAAQSGPPRWAVMSVRSSAARGTTKARSSGVAGRAASSGAVVTGSATELADLAEDRRPGPVGGLVGLDREQIGPG